MAGRDSGGSGARRSRAGRRRGGTSSRPAGSPGAPPDGPATGAGADDRLGALLFEAARELRPELGRIAEALPLGLVVRVRGRIVFANAAARALAGVEALEAVRGVLDLALVPPEAREDAVARSLAQQRRGAPLRRNRVPIRRPDGTVRWIDVTTVPFRMGSDPAALSLVVDATERVAEESRAVAEAHVAGVGTVAAALAHQLGNPLAAARVAVRLALDRARAGEPRGAVVEAIEDLGRLLERMDRAVRAILTLARVREAAPGPVDALELARAAAEEARPEIEARGGSIEVARDGALPPLRGSTAQLLEALRNLVRNAIEAHDGPPRVRIAVAARGDAVEIAVEDRGRGIDPGLRPHLFEPFRSGTEGGTGLGLPIARAIALAHGGDLRLEPRRGGGTRACLRLPASDAAARGERRSPARPDPRTPAPADRRPLTRPDR